MEPKRAYLVGNTRGIWQAKDAMSGGIVATGASREQAAGRATKLGYYFAY